MSFSDSLPALFPSLSDEIAAQPGGEELAQLVRKVEDSKPYELREIQDGWRRAAEDTEERERDLERIASQIRDEWTGPTAEAFTAYLDQLVKGFRVAQEALSDAVGGLDRAARTVEVVKEVVLDIGERALAEAKPGMVDQALPSLMDPQRAEELREMQVRRIMAQHAADASARIEQAEAELNGALVVLAKSTHELEGAFSRIPEPGASAGDAAGGTLPPASTEQQSAAPAQPAAPGGAGGAAESGGSGAGGSAAAVGSGGSAGGSSGSSGSSGGGQSGGLGPSGGPPTSGPPPGNVEEWIREAIRILQANGVPVTEDNIDEIWTIIEKESSGDPHAINDWDSNAAKGTPSKGLMQCIDPTFEAYKLPGHDDIWNPVDNIIAGVRYIFDRYGGFEGHPGLKSMAQGGEYQGY